MKKFGHLDLLQVFRAQLSLVLRMPEKIHARRELIHGKGAKKRRGGQKKKWATVVKEDLRGEGVENLTEKLGTRLLRRYI